MGRYNTNQRKALADFFKEHRDTYFSTDEIVNSLCSRGDISKSAIYRNIDKLVREGSLQKSAEEGSRKFLYRYVNDDRCGSHLHLKCLLCGSVYHMDDRQTQIVLSAAKGSSFVIDEKRTVLYGMCERCRPETGEKG